MKTAVIILCAVAAFIPARADEASKSARIEQLLEITRTRATLEQSQQDVRKMMHQMLLRSTPSLEGSPILKDLEQVIQEEVSSATKWESMKPDFIKVYSETFTEDEISGLVSFYQTPLGQTVVTKLPLVMTKTMALTQQRMQAVFPEMQKRIQEIMDRNQKKPAQAEPK